MVGGVYRFSICRIRDLSLSWWSLWFLVLLIVFEVLQARTVDDAPDPDYPNPGTAQNSYVPEPDDGQPTFIPATAVIAKNVSNGSREVGRAERITALLAVTESRVVFSCTEFRTGGGWRGYGGLAGPLVAVTMNAASRASNVRKTRGYTLVGHVRYGWLAVVLAQDRKLGASQTALKFTFIGPDDVPTVYSLSVYLDRHQSAVALGGDISRRAIDYKIAHSTGDLQARFEEFASGDHSTALPSGHGRVWQFPS